MKQQINEIRRMQFLAGLINESQLNEDNLVLSNYAKQLYSLFKKAGATPIITVGKNYTSPDVKNSNVYITVTNSGALQVGVKGNKPTAEKYMGLVSKQFPDLELKGNIEIGTGWGGEQDTHASLTLVPKTTAKGGDINPNQRPNAPKPAAAPATPAPQQESIEQAVNEALRKYRRGKLNENITPEQKALTTWKTRKNGNIIDGYVFMEIKPEDIKQGWSKYKAGDVAIYTKQTANDQAKLIGYFKDGEGEMLSPIK
jgi:hypothetical protein